MKMSKKKKTHQVVVDLLQQVSDFFIRILILVMPIGHEEVHDSATVPVVGHGIKMHKVFILWHLVLLRYGHQHLDRLYKWRRHCRESGDRRTVIQYNNACKTHVRVEETRKRQAAMKGDSKHTRMWVERKKGGEKFCKSPTYKCYRTFRKNHAIRKEVT